MDAELLRLVASDTPPFNPLLANGIAAEAAKSAETYVDQVWRSASKGFPPGLTYEGWEKCTPQEEFLENTKRKGPRRTYDTAPSNFFMVKYKLAFNGVRLPPRYIYLPFIGDAGTIVISGSRFTVSPVLADRVISIDTSTIFVRLLRDRLTFERVAHHYMRDGKRMTAQVAWSSIYHTRANKNNQNRPKVKAHCSLMHYLLCKYGFTDTFLKYGNCKPVIGTHDINPTNYPPEQWVICESTGLRPRTWGKGFWEPSQIKLAVPRPDMENLMVQNMVAGFFYTVDHFPSRVQASTEWVDRQRMWMILLGQIIFSPNASELTLYEDIKDHIDSLDEYLDGIVLQSLAEIGHPVKDVYDLFAMTIEKISDMMLGAAGKISSMYDKELNVLYYLLFDVTSAIFRFHFKLRAAYKKARLGTGRDLSEKEIVNTMNLTLKTGLIFGMIKGSHGEVSTISVPGDNKATKITTVLVPQSGSNRTAQKKERTDLKDPSIRLHVSVAEIGGYSNLPKSEPSGRARLNIHATIDSKGVVQRNPKWQGMLEPIQESLKR